MSTVRYFTAGESHGKALIGILEGIPSGFSLSPEDINKDLRRRQGGYGRGGRMQIEADQAEILSGVRWGKTTGAPIAVLVRNRDWENWREGMSPSEEYAGSIPPVVRPRPGHADLAGALKYHTRDMRDILERSSARETAMRVAVGAAAKKVLAAFAVRIGSLVIRIGSVGMKTPKAHYASEKKLLSLYAKSEKSPVRCPDSQTSSSMVKLIDEAVKKQTSLGGVFQVFVAGVPAGLGSHIQWDKKIDGRLARAFMSIQAIKGVEIGDGFDIAGRFGAEVMDEIFFSKGHAVRGMGFYRKTNHAGGIEGGITNGMPVIITAAMKPIPTLRRPLRSVDITTKKASSAAYERSDICAVPAAAVVGESMAALTIADAFFEKFGGDSMEETTGNLRHYLSLLKEF
jgi:chorismate synthase